LPLPLTLTCPLDRISNGNVMWLVCRALLIPSRICFDTWILPGNDVFSIPDAVLICDDSTTGHDSYLGGQGRRYTQGVQRVDPQHGRYDQRG